MIGIFVEIPLLTAKRNIRVGGYLEYFIGTDFENPSKNLSDEHSLANLKGDNIVGSEYILYDHQTTKNRQTGAVIYVSHSILFV